VQFQHNSILFNATHLPLSKVYRFLHLIIFHLVSINRPYLTVTLRNVSNTRVRGIVLSNCSKVLARLYTLLSRKRKKEKERKNNFRFLNYKCIDFRSLIVNILQITLLITNRRRDRQFLSSRVDSQVRK